MKAFCLSRRCGVRQSPMAIIDQCRQGLANAANSTKQHNGPRWSVLIAPPGTEFSNPCNANNVRRYAFRKSNPYHSPNTCPEISGSTANPAQLVDVHSSEMISVYEKKYLLSLSRDTSNSPYIKVSLRLEEPMVCVTDLLGYRREGQR